MSRVLKSSDTIITQKFKGIGVHNGVDLVGANHTTCPIVAHSDGIVEMAVSGKGNNINATGDATYGNFVKIKHSNGYATLYAHLDKVYVKVGDRVSKGQEIGYMGNSGRSFNAHQHFEVRKNGTYKSIIDPTPYLNADLPGLSTSSLNYINKPIVGEWQRAMNSSFNCGLAVDNSYGPASRSASKKYQLFWKDEEMHNVAVRFVQRKLNQLGFTDDMGNKLVENGYFGINTNAAVCKYQKARNIKVDGFVGEATIEWLLKDNY